MIHGQTPPMTTNATDPRPLYAAAIDRVCTLLPGATDLDAPTPCAEFDVRALLGHLLTTVERAHVVGEGGDVHSVPLVITGVADDAWADTYRAAADEALAVWTDDALLDTDVVVPWGAVPGRGALWGYLNEALVHGWDLAVATGQDPEADPALAAAALDAARGFLPADSRGGPVPFAAVVEPRAGAGPTERLANWSGRTS